MPSEQQVSLPILIGGIKNALDRGETLQKAKQSFISAGYKPEDVEAAIQKVPTKKLEAQNQSSIIQNSQQQVGQPSFQATQQLPQIQLPEKKLSTTFKIILAIGVVLILVAAALLGLFWGKI